jgi:Uma2 family endonuclease
MARRPQHHYSEDEYFAVEATSSIRHEYYDGEIFAMAGASVRHNHISANVIATLRAHLRMSDYSAFGSDLRLRTPGGLYTYPDVMVICGKIELSKDRPDTVTNPSVLVEVLSDATEEYDRGDKFALYKTIPTFREYLLDENGAWPEKTYSKLTEKVNLSTLNLLLSVAEVYERVFD